MGTVVDHHHHNLREVPVVILNTGARISALGFGSDTLGPVEEIENAVISAVKMGYRHFDTAASHGTEEAVGRGLKQALQNGLVKREEIFVTLKVEDIDADEVLAAVKNSLSVLQLDYLDLCLLQTSTKLRKSNTLPPKLKEDVPLSSSVQDRWQALEECQQGGLTKAIGVSNFTAKKVKDLLEYAKVLPAVNQVELHPMWQQKQLVEFCRSVGVRVISSQPLGGQPPLSVTDNPVIKEIAHNHAKTCGQIALRWMLENGFISIIRAYDSGKLSEYIDILDFKLSSEDHDRIASIDQKALSTWDLSPKSS